MTPAFKKTAKSEEPSDDALPQALTSRGTTGDSPVEIPRSERLGVSYFVNTAEVSDALYEVELASYLDTDVPTSSRLPLAKPVKMVVSKLGGFYARFITDQLTVLARELLKAMRLLVDTTNSKVALVPTIQPAELSAVAKQRIIEHLTSAEGRVLVLDCATPKLLNELETADIDAYGIAAGIGNYGFAAGDESATIAQETIVQNGGLAYDLRHVSPSGHLAQVPMATLGGALLHGFTDQAPVARKLELLAGVVAACKPGARIAIVTATTDSWEKRLDVIAQDLVDGRPFNPATWEFLLAEHGAIDTASSLVDDETVIVTGCLR